MSTRFVAECAQIRTYLSLYIVKTSNMHNFNITEPISLRNDILIMFWSINCFYI